MTAKQKLIQGTKVTSSDYSSKEFCKTAYTTQRSSLQHKGGIKSNKSLRRYNIFTTKVNLKNHASNKEINLQTQVNKMFSDY